MSQRQIRQDSDLWSTDSWAAGSLLTASPSCKTRINTAQLRRQKREREQVRRKRHLKHFIAATAIVMALGSVLVLGVSQVITLPAFAGIAQDQHAPPAGSQIADSLSYLADPFPSQKQPSQLYDTGYLVLVNRDYPLREIPLRSAMSDTHLFVPSSHDGIGLHSSALTAVEEMFKAAERAGTGPFHVSSGHRDFVRQMQLYKSINDSSLVQPPGHSEHHTGLAADILPTALVTSGTPLDQQLDGSSPEEQWLADNSWAYGLILRYPPGTQHLTGIAFEPWHFRYVGLPHAWYMWHHDLTLEEYLCKLASVGGFDVTIDKQNYAVRYSTATDGVIYVPSDKYFTLSSTNRGSYIVTALSDERVD